MMRMFIITFAQVKKDSLNTIGMEFGTRIIHIADKSIKLQIWDTAGQASKFYRWNIANNAEKKILSGVLSQERFRYIQSEEDGQQNGGGATTD